MVAKPSTGDKATCRGCGRLAPWGASCFVCGLVQDPERLKWLYLVRRTILPEGKDKAKHVLRVLADHAWAGPNQDMPPRVDGECVLLMRTIACEASMSMSSAERAIKWLEAENIIERESRGRRGGGRGANLYRLLPSNGYEDG